MAGAVALDFGVDAPTYCAEAFRHLMYLVRVIIKLIPQHSFVFLHSPGYAFVTLSLFIFRLSLFLFSVPT